MGTPPEKLIAGMRDGTVIDNRQQRFKPSTIRGYERTLTKRLPVWFSRMKVRDVTRGDVREVVAEWRRAGHETKDGPLPLSASTVPNRTDALRTLFRQAQDDELFAATPAVRLKLETAKGKRSGSRPRTRLMR